MSGRMNTKSSRHYQWESEFADDEDDHIPKTPDLAQRLCTLFEEELYTDVTFVVTRDTRSEIKAHRVVLAAGSQEFSRLLYGRDVGGERIVLVIRDTSYEAFRNVLEYLYTDHVSLNDFSSAKETLAAARKFQVHSLVNFCESYIEMAEITEENACDTLQLAIENQIESLKHRCTEFIQQNTQGVLRSRSFKTCNLSTIATIGSLPQLNLHSETEFLEAVLEWIEFQPESNKPKRELFEQLLRHIRFMDIPVIRFLNLLPRCQDMFSGGEAANISTYLANPTIEVPLPPWFNKGKNRCSSEPQETGNNWTDKRIIFSLKHVEEGHLSKLICWLELKCLAGKFRLKAIKMTFSDQVTAHSSIGRMILTVSCDSTNYKFQEYLRIQGSQDITVPFSKPMLIYQGQVVTIKAEANDVRNYKFLQFDQDNQSAVRGNCPFEISLGSSPKEKHLFFISEVVYCSLSDRRRRK